ncbi:hypothetical protein BDZ90DRAFT_18130 [Jaminaea rosea]|uniref:Uncharacterized protein n=1 Tax=Jaminaea rosea TaxID=1569628 RepID=A0A316UZ55_9BASI|nr:hypothetical protein BDZ90DRAFT_18130 [Jaminaea rosea]PWN30580.1 hypothetical protein BDZ90DRAFT_18130 [Jaminaea rosea]
MAVTTANGSPAGRADVGLGRPSSSSGKPTTLTTSLSLSGSLSSSSSQSLSPLPLARSEYSSAAHAFIQRNPLKSLKDLEEARRLLFAVITFEDPVRKLEGWTTLREKVVILWITLLVSIWKKEHGVLSFDELPTATRELLKGSTRAESFLPKLVSEVLLSWAQSASDVDSLRSANPTIEVGADASGVAKKQLYASLPSSVAASLVMAALGVEEAAGNSTSTGQSTPSPSAVPIARSLAETLLTAYTNAHDADSKTASALAAYGRVMELYAVHVLGVRCGQWDYADQVVRLSLLEDEARARLLLALSRAQTHIVTRPQRRASAALAQQKAYEAEKQRRASEAKTRAEAEAETIDAASSTAAGPSKRGGKTSRPRAGRQSSHDDGYLSGASTGPESSHASAAESEGEGTSSPSSSRRSRPRSSNGSPTDEKSGFAATRANLSRDIAKNRQKDEAHSASNDTSGSSSVAARSQASSATSRTSSGSLTLLQTWLKAFKSLNLPMMVSVLAPMIVLLMSVRRLMLRRGGTGVAEGRRAAVNSARGGRGGERGEQGALMKALGRLWATARMGTQVTYL